MRIEITYASGVKQEKDVISHAIFSEIIKPAKDRLHTLNAINKGKLISAEQQEMLQLKESLKPYSNPFCTDQSPIFKAKETGILILTENQGGEHKVLIREI